jgi:hypothetical protein
LDPVAARDELTGTWRVRFIVVHRSANTRERTFIAAVGARLIDRDDSRLVYEIK